MGACLQTEFRTEENDNDKAKKYFGDPAQRTREKNAVLRGTEQEEDNALVEKLKAQTRENEEKNRLEVERKTFENDQVGILIDILDLRVHDHLLCRLC